MTRAKSSKNRMTAAAAEAALSKLSAMSLLSGKDLQRLRIIAGAIDDTLQCSLNALWDTLFKGLEPINAETTLRKLKLRLKEVQQEAVHAGQLNERDLLELNVDKKSGNEPRFLWFFGPVALSVEPRTEDIKGVPQNALQPALVLPPELAGHAPAGSEPILILTINDHETKAVREVFSPGQTPKQFERDIRNYELLGHAGLRPVIGYRCRMGSVGSGSALVTTIKAIEHHRPAVVLGVGIAFGNKKKNQQLGDVLISTEVRNYESERINPDASRTSRGDQIPASTPWVMRATQLSPEGFNLHKGLMLSGEKLLDHEDTLQQLLKQFPAAIGGDMEGAGLMTACHEGKVDWLVIKAISDWGDGNKNAVGENEKEQHQQMAAQHAARVAFAAIHLAWPSSMPAETATKAKRPTRQTKNKEASIGRRAELSFEAKTPDFKALEVLLNNHGSDRGVQERQSQANPLAAYSAPVLAAHESLLEWLQTTGAPPVFALLGEYGMGKTISCQRLYHDLRERRTQINPPEWVREPLYFDLRTLSLFKNRERTQTVDMPGKDELINDLIKHGWRNSPGNAVPNYIDIQALLTQGALLILDGLDECLVHLVDAQHPTFIRSLLELLTDADPDGTRGTRLLLSCRTNFFKTLDDQINFFTGQHRGRVDAQWYRSMVLQPFTETQIRQYLAEVVPDVPADCLMDLVRNTHNLSELAERPMTLKLIGGQIQELESLRLRGESINGARLYELVAKSWLERDEGKHHLQPEHKLRLMPDLAAHLWRTGARSLPYQDLHRWFHEWRSHQPDLRERYGPVVYNQNKLEEDLRTATFVVREDQGASRAEGFRFAHSSLLEFFLARYLFTAIVEDQPERWALPMPSQETRNFLADLLDSDQHARSQQGRDMDETQNTLNRWRKTYRPQVSELLLKLALTGRTNTPKPVLAGFDLRGAQVQGWFFGSPESQESTALLNMQACQLQGADLREARFHHVRLDGTNFSGARLHQASFEHCRLPKTLWASAQLVGTVFRVCDLRGSDLPEAKAYRAQLVDCDGKLPEASQEALSAKSASWLAPPIQGSSQPRLAWLTGHISGVSSVAFSPDGSRIASTSFDHTVRLWDAHSGELLHTLEGHQDIATSVVFSPDGSRIASASHDRTLRLWDATSGEPMLTPFRCHEGSVYAVAFSPDGSRIVSASGDRTLRLWNATNGEPMLPLRGHRGPILAVAFSPDGSRIASASQDKTLRLWDTSTGKSLLTLRGHRGAVNAVAFSLDGSQIASASDDLTLRLWDATSGEPVIPPLQGHQYSVNAVAFSPDGCRIASASSDRTLRLWDATSGEPLHILRGHGNSVNAVAFSPDGQRLVSASSDRNLRVWSATSGEPLLNLRGYQGSVIALAFSPDGSRIASASSSRTLRLWNTISGNPTITLTGHESSISAIAFSPDGQLIASASHDHTLRLWEATSGKPLVTLQGHHDLVTAVVFSPDGSRIASASSDRTLRLWNATSGGLLLTLQGHKDKITSVAFSPDGSYIISASIDRTLRLWDAISGKLVLPPLRGHQGAINAVSFSPDGSCIASASGDRTLCVWSVSSGEPILTSLRGHRGSVSAVAFSPDGLRIVSASNDRTLRLWDAMDGKPLLTPFRGHEGWINTVAFSPDGSSIASASHDGTLRLWDASSGTALRAHWAGARNDARGHAVWEPPGADVRHPNGRLISASGDAWRLLGWQVWDHPSAPGQWTRLPLGPYPSEAAAA